MGRCPSCNVCHSLALKNTDLKWAINYTDTRSPGHLERHLECFHEEIWVDHNRQSAVKSVDGAGPMDRHIHFNSEFERKYLKWIVGTYQPLTTCEDQEFREMCLALSNKAPMLDVGITLPALYF